MNKKTSTLYTVVSIVLYTLAALLTGYFIWAFINTFNQFSDLIAQGQLTFRGNEFNIINQFMFPFALYFVPALVLVALGLLLQKNRTAIYNGSDINILDEKSDE